MPVGSLSGREQGFCGLLSVCSSCDGSNQSQDSLIQMEKPGCGSVLFPKSEQALPGRSLDELWAMPTNQECWQEPADLPDGKPGRHRAGEAEEKLWFLGGVSPVAASAECFVSGSGLTGNPILAAFQHSAVLAVGTELLGMVWDPSRTGVVPDRARGVCRFVFSAQPGLSKEPGSPSHTSGARIPPSSQFLLEAGRVPGNGGSRCRQLLLTAA